MLWQPIAFSLLLAVLFTLAVVPLLGWRRPGHTEDEGAWASGAFLFLLLFLSLWASSAWLRPVGPEFWGVPWVSLGLMGLIVVFLLVAVSGFDAPKPRYDAAARKPTPGDVAAVEDAREVAEGFGALFWVLVSLLLLLAVLGSFA